MIDSTFILQDSAAFTASGAGTVLSVAKIADLGAGRMTGEMIVDVTAIEIASNNEFYDLTLQGSTSATFAGTYTVLTQLELGAKEVISSDLDSAIGRYRLPFTNEQPDGTVYPYARIYAALGGSISTGITFSAHLEKAKS